MPDSHRNPGLRLHTSNRLETLVAALAQVTQAPLSSPFRPETIVVQSQGMARWIRQCLAEHHGVCANVAFPFPNEMASRLFLALFPDLPARPPFDRETLLWLVMKHLPALLDEPAFEDPRHYLADRTDLRKRHQLARKVAYLLDQYFIFRPDMIRAWDQGEDRQWQAELWRRIRPEIPYRHPAELHEQFTRLLREPGLEISRLPERLCVFGISALPPFHLDLFAALGAHLPVHLFAVQPSRFYWGDITSGREEEQLLKRHGRPPSAAAELHLERGNRLLASLGALGRDFLKLIYASGDWHEHDDFTEPEENTLLACVQSDILNLRDRGQKGTSETATTEPSPALRQRDSATDDSIQVHSCHSPLREMEVLNDQLLEWLNHDRDLAPRDIVVMMPDLEAYAPFIDAVFGAPENESLRIPFRIADRGARQASQIVRSFLDLLHLQQTRLGAATVLALLENHHVRERFAVSEPDLELIRRWIDETRIRWGADPEHRARLELPAVPGNTWREGLDRLLLGYAMASQGGTLFNDILPYDALEGDSALVLGRLVDFIERLFDTVTDLGRPRRLDEWVVRLRRVLDEFFLADEESERDLQTIRSTLNEFHRQYECSHFDEPMGIDVVLEHLTPELEVDRHGGGFLSGGVTFCALKPMRSIPFKVICLVGMNDAAFPRPNAHLGFDQMARSPRLGDRSTRNDDRYLFLETILSARRRLYLSYVGQSIRDNSTIPPSVVVSELLDYVEQGFGCQREDLILQHRLQAFHPAYFHSAGRLFSYSAENCRASQSALQPETIRTPFVNAPLPEPEAESRQLTLDDLATFLRNPAAFLLRQRLNVRLRKTDGALDERELFELDARDAYPLKQRLLGDRLAGMEPAQALSQFAATGVLPLGQVGQARSHSISVEVDSFWQRLERFDPRRARNVLDVDLDLAGFRLTGRVLARESGGSLNARVASVKAKDTLALWLQHLACGAVGHGGESILIGTNATHSYRPCDHARETLRDLLELYWQGLRQPLKFFPRASRAFAQAEHRLTRNPRSRVNPLAEALKQWEGNKFGGVSAERDDLGFELCFGNVLPLDEEFAALARRVFDPVLRHETVEKA